LSSNQAWTIHTRTRPSLKIQQLKKQQLTWLVEKSQSSWLSSRSKWQAAKGNSHLMKNGAIIYFVKNAPGTRIAVNHLAFEGIHLKCSIRTSFIDISFSFVNHFLLPFFQLYQIIVRLRETFILRLVCLPVTLALLILIRNRR